MNALKMFLSEHDRVCGKRVYISEPFECTCGLDAAAAELAAMEAVIEAARKVTTDGLEYNKFAGWVELRDKDDTLDSLAAALADYDKKGS